MIFNRPRRREKKRLTWYFNETLNNTELETIRDVPFISGGKKYIGLAYDGKKLNYITEQNAWDVAYWPMIGGWQEERRTITFEEEPTGDLLAFLEANAMPQ